MKLELKDLAPYLPYDLQIKVTDQYFDKPIPNSIFTVKWISDYQNCFPDRFVYLCCDTGLSFINNTAKPILCPLSDLTETQLQEFNLDLSDQIDLIDLRDQNTLFSDIRYGLAEFLFEQHFDVFGLIEKGLAIKKEP